MSFAEAIRKAKGATVTPTIAKSLLDPNVNLPGDNTLEKLRNLYNIRKTGKLPLVTSVKPQSRRLIAICVVIVDCLFHEDIWKEWIDQTHKLNGKYCARLFIQAKHPSAIKSEWVRSQLLSETFEPSWNSPEVIRAMLACMNAGLEYCDDNIQCERFVFVTEFCIPILSLEEAGNRLFADDKSWLDARHEPIDHWERQHCFWSVRQDIIPNEAVSKALPGWIMMTRRHAAELYALVTRLGGYKERGQDLITAFGPGGSWNDHCQGVFAPEEVFFATMLTLLGYLRVEGPDEVLRKRVVYAEWDKRGSAHPNIFCTLNKSSLDKFLLHGSVFARKFPKGSVDLHSWQLIVMGEFISPVAEGPLHDDDSNTAPAIKRQKVEQLDPAATH